MKWYERYPLRIQAEKIIMAENHPQFVLKINDKKNLFWEGLLRTNLGAIYVANIDYPSTYPWEKPKLKIIRPTIQSNAPHRYTDGTLCVYPKNFDYRRWTGPAGVPLLAGWLALYEIFLRTGKRW